MSTNTDPRLDPTRVIRAPRGSQLSCKNWIAEAAFRMIQNNLDPEVAENPQHLVVYGGIGRAARDWACFDQVLERGQDLVEAGPVARGAADAAVDDQVLRVLGHLGVEVVLDHAVGRFGDPVLATQLAAARGADDAGLVEAGIGVGAHACLLLSGQVNALMGLNVYTNCAEVN